jgi:hypothetical protein
MRSRILLLSLWIIAWAGLFFWWMSSWPASVTTVDTGEDLLWRSIQKKENGWERVVFSPEKNSDFTSYQEWQIILYWQWEIPKIQKNGEEYTIELTSGQWIIRSLSQTQTSIIKSPNTEIRFTGVWWIMSSVSEKLVVNFDAEMTLNGGKLLPSFLSRDGKTEFFDLSENTEIIPADLWLIYTSFFPRDQEKALGNVSKKFLDSMIKTLLSREPESKTFGIFRRDIRVRNALEEIESLINKIEVGDSCGTDGNSCFTILDDVLDRERDTFPDIFLPLERAIQSWIQMGKSTQNNDYSWASIFRIYHTQLITGDARARANRDKAILEMIQLGTTVSSVEIWWFLTEMLASQKLGSAYSLQIVREMIRIWDVLQNSTNVSVDVSKTLTNSAIESLSNLKSILENTYFTKKEYWFVLRDDLEDEEGNTIQNQVFINDLQDLIRQIDTSWLIQNSSSENEANLRVIRAQLAWFSCIFVRNDEYVKNTRICRTTIR